jgi:DNA polymerase III delta prime subunit
MTTSDFLNPLNSIELILMDRYINEMITLYNSKKFPKVLLLNGKKGIGKLTLTIHFLNYIFTKNEKKPYDLKNKKINSDSIFYNQLLNQTNQDVLLIEGKENKNIKIEDIRNLKTTLSTSSLSKNPRFTIIDEVEYMNENSANALLKTLEEPTDNNFFILINNQQADLLKTISSRCVINNIFINSEETNTIIEFLLQNNKIENLINSYDNLTPGLFLCFNEIYLRLNIEENENISSKINKLLNDYKKIKDKVLINLTLFLIDQYFLKLIQTNENKLDFLLNIKSDIVNNINDFIYYNLNINSVLNSIDKRLKNA